MQKIVEHYYGEDPKGQFGETIIPDFENNKNIIKYCNLIINSSDKNTKLEFPYQQNPYHEITILKQYSGCWNDSNRWQDYVIRLRIIHHNGINVIDEIDLVKSLFPDTKEQPFFQYRLNAEVDYYEPNVYWKLTDSQMDYHWLEDKLKITAVSSL